MDFNQLEEQEAIDFWKRILAKFDEEEQQAKAKVLMRDVRETPRTREETIADLRQELHDPTDDQNLEQS